MTAATDLWIAVAYIAVGAWRAHCAWWGDPAPKPENEDAWRMR